MIFSVVIYSAPYTSESAANALRFSQAVVDKGHQIYRLFFFSDGVHNANKLAITPQDEQNLQAIWDSFIRSNKLDSVVCVSSALKRGIIGADEARNHDLDSQSLQPSSNISGLGQFVDAYIKSDRVISFG